MRDTKTCIQCGRTFERRKKETRLEFGARKYCGRECAQLARQPVPQAKVCRHCGRVFLRSHEESQSTWTRRLYCSRACVTAAWRCREARLPHEQARIGALLRVILVAAQRARAGCLRYPDGRDMTAADIASLVIEGLHAMAAEARAARGVAV